MSMRRTAVVSGVFFCALIMAGCANQATVVDLEDSTLKLKMVQRGLQRRIDALEKNLPASSSTLLKNQRSLTAELSAQVEELRKEVQDSTGRVSEAAHRISAIENRMDSESFRTTEILGRLDQLAEQIASIEQKGTMGGSKKKNNGKDTSSFWRPTPNVKKSLSPRQAYNLAYNDYVNGNYDFAISAFDAFIEHYPGSRLVPEALYWKGESYYGKGSYALAVEFFNQVIKEYPKSGKVSKSFLKAGFALFELQKPVEGSRYLRELLKRFPTSNEAPLAKNKLATLD